MQQQINFYEFMDHPVRSSLDSKKIVFLYAILIVILVMLQFYGNHIKNTEQTKLDTALGEQQILNTRLAQAQAKFTAITGETVFGASLCKTKFSTYLDAFAKASVQGVWITSFQISDAGKGFLIVGRSTQNDQAHQFMEALKKQTIFAAFTFEFGELTGVSKAAQNSTAVSEYYNFSIVAKAKTS
jgi:hypothetical protein